jgi:hypothetical protein
VFAQLADKSGASAQSGTAAFAVAAGDVLGFSLDCRHGGFGPANIAISSFSAPAAVPELASLVLMGAGLLGLAGAAWRRRRTRTW